MASLQELREAITRGGAVKPLPATAEFEPADEVMVQDGPLRGVRGLLGELRGGRQLIIWVSAIGRGVAFKIGAALAARARGANFIRGCDD